MKTLIGLLLWIAAAAVAVMLLIYLWRGRRILLGRRSSRIFGMAVFLLVLLGVGAERLRAEFQNPRMQEERRRLLESTPQLLRNGEFISKWRFARENSDIARFFMDLDALAALPADAVDTHAGSLKARIGLLGRYPEPALKPIQRVVAARLDPGGAPPALAAKDISAALDSLEAAGMLQGAEIRLFWKALPGVIREDREGAVELTARLLEAARIQDALVAASFGVAPFNVRAWMSKAGRRPEDIQEEERAVGLTIGALPYEYARSDGGLWVREARARFKLASGAGVRIQQGGKTTEVLPGGPIEFNRLSVLWTAEAAVGEHEWIGLIRLPARSTLFVFDLPTLLDEPAAARVRATVDAALAGDEQAAVRIERSLPLTHAALRAGLAASPESPGAPALRLMSSLFE